MSNEISDDVKLTVGEIIMKAQRAMEDVPVEIEITYKLTGPLAARYHFLSVVMQEAFDYPPELMAGYIISQGIKHEWLRLEVAANNNVLGDNPGVPENAGQSAPENPSVRVVSTE